MRRRAVARTALAFVLATALVGPRVSNAASAIGTMGVAATVVDSCSVVATPLTFATYSAANGQSIGQGTITVTCTIATAVSLIGLDFGANAVAGVAQLRASGAALIPYVLYVDAPHTVPWTLAVGPTAYAASATPSVFDVYGVAPGGANVPVGAYTDEVGITVTYV